MSNFFLDTNFILSLWFQEDSNHQKAIAILSNIAGHELYTSSCNLAELNIYDTNFSFLEIIEEMEITILPITAKDSENIKSVDFQYRKQLKAIDCLILSKCISNSLKLITFDAKLNKVASKLSVQII